MRRNIAKTILKKVNFAFWFLLYLVICDITHDVPSMSHAHFPYRQNSTNLIRREKCIISKEWNDKPELSLKAPTTQSSDIYVH